MKNKMPAIIMTVIVLLSILYSFNTVKKQNERKEPRTAPSYLVGNVTYDNALNKGREYFLNTIKLVANDYFEYDKSFEEKINIYLINNVDGYVMVKNYDLIDNFLNAASINKYNEIAGYINFENKHYIKNYSKNINDKYVGSIINIETSKDNIITYKAINYYCDDYKFIGILDLEPYCNIINKTETTFTLVYDNNMLKINDINEFLDTKKIY